MELGPYELNTIVTGDARELAKAIPDESVDVIFTDPPYAKEYLPLYGWIARTGNRILKEGGFLCVIAGGYYLDCVFQEMSGQGLDWYFKIEYLISGDAPVIWPRRIVTRTKPILLWTKGNGVIQLWNMTDVYQGQAPNKRYHKWGQGVGSARYCIEYILGANKDSVVLDPFSGGGSTLQACKYLRVNWLGFEIDSNAVKSAYLGLAEMQPPLFVPEPEQIEMEIAE